MADSIGTNRDLFVCSSCLKPLFWKEDIIDGNTLLWDLGEYKAECYSVKDIIDFDTFRRYDCSLHEGWYCCRFIVMRMLVDKFGTGDKLLVYKDSVKQTTEAQWKQLKGKDSHNKQSLEGDSKQAPKHHGQIKLGRRDYKLVLESDALKEKLLVCKYGAIWCPPCRLMDSIFGQIDTEKLLNDVIFFEVDVDEEEYLASQWHNSGIPFLVFYYGGKQFQIVDTGGKARWMGIRLVDGGIESALKKQQIVELCTRILQSCRQGKIEFLL